MQQNAAVTNNVFKHRMTREAWGWMRGKIVNNIHTPQMTTATYIYGDTNRCLVAKTKVWGLNRGSPPPGRLAQRKSSSRDGELSVRLAYTFCVLLPFAHVCVWAAVALLSPLCLPWDLASFSHSALSNASDLQTAERRAENELLYTAAITTSLPHSVQNLSSNIPNVYMVCSCLPFTENKIP